MLLQLTKTYGNTVFFSEQRTLSRANLIKNV